MCQHQGEKQNEQEIQMRKEQLKQAIDDYFNVTDSDNFYHDVTDDFIDTLAKESYEAKQNLRTLFKKHPAYNYKLDAIVLSSKATKNKDAVRIKQLTENILEKAILAAKIDGRYFTYHDLYFVIRFLITDKKELENEYNNTTFKTITKIVGDKFRPDRKKSRTFLQIAKALGVYKSAAGSEFQSLYAQLADEFVNKQIDFKLYLSLNPAHMLTMSNPKDTYKGDMLTTCQSLNTSENEYASGCSGYARDDVTFIAFTVTDDNSPSTFHNRKLTRQLFSYKVGNGVLLQNRLYSTFNETQAHDELNSLYRHLIQQTIAQLEELPNLWVTKSVTKMTSEERLKHVKSHERFGGYADWRLNPDTAKICILKSKMQSYTPLIVGNAGLCICCADESEHSVYCQDCYYDYHTDCSICDTPTHHRDLTFIENIGSVCSLCEDNLSVCDKCDQYIPPGETYSMDGDTYCSDCVRSFLNECDSCGQMSTRDELYHLETHDVNLCEDCYEQKANYCSHCDRYFYNEEFRWHDDELCCIECIDKQH